MVSYYNFISGHTGTGKYPKNSVMLLIFQCHKSSVYFDQIIIKSSSYCQEQGSIKISQLCNLSCSVICKLYLKMSLHDNSFISFTCVAGAFLDHITSAACFLFSISSVLSIWSQRNVLNFKDYFTIKKATYNVTKGKFPKVMFRSHVINDTKNKTGSMLTILQHRGLAKMSRKQQINKIQ